MTSVLSADDLRPYSNYSKQLPFELLIPDRLDGTRTSANWAKPPGGMDRLNTRAVFPSSNQWDIPDLPVTDVRPEALVAYHDIHSNLTKAGVQLRPRGGSSNG